MSLENISRLAKVLSLPITRKIKDGTSIIIDKLQENDLNEAYKVFMRYAAGGDGISKVCIITRIWKVIHVIIYILY